MASISFIQFQFFYTLTWELLLEHLKCIQATSNESVFWVSGYRETCCYRLYVTNVGILRSTHQILKCVTKMWIMVKLLAKTIVSYSLQTTASLSITQGVLAFTVSKTSCVCAVKPVPISTPSLQKCYLVLTSRFLFCFITSHPHEKNTERWINWARFPVVCYFKLL